MVAWLPEVFLAEVTSGRFCAGHHKDLTATGNRASPWHLIYLNGFVTEQFCSFFSAVFFSRALQCCSPQSPNFFCSFVLFVCFFFRMVFVCFCFRCALCRRRRLCFRLSMYYNIMSVHNCFLAEISIQERPDPAEVMYQIKGVRLLCLCKSDLKILLLQINSKLNNQVRLRN